MKLQVSLLVLLTLSAIPPAVLAQFDHQIWDRLLHAHVEVFQQGSETRVRYDGMLMEREALSDYLSSAARVTTSTFESWPQSERLAFLINIYNAATIELVLTHYPEIDSIREIGSLFRSPWSLPVVSLFGGQVSLDEIEHEMIRSSGEFNEPRIHFAVNCAAIGCPPLRAESYVGARLEQQLDENTRLFLSDRSRNYVQNSRLYVSKIFDWYESDFERGWNGVDSVAEFLSGYAVELGLNAEELKALQEDRLSFRYLRYDWDMNRSQ